MAPMGRPLKTNDRHYVVIPVRMQEFFASKWVKFRWLEDAGDDTVSAVGAGEHVFLPRHRMLTRLTFCHKILLVG